MMRLLFPEFIGGRGAVGLLIIRLVTGTAFIIHGWSKIQNPFAWSNPERGIPGLFQACAAVAEFGGGIALILGLLTPIASLGIAFTMMVAIGMDHIPEGHVFVSRSGNPSFELPGVYLANVLMLFLVGPGTLSLDALLFRRARAGTNVP
jgi:putative oxidoreductase